MEKNKDNYKAHGYDSENDLAHGDKDNEEDAVVVYLDCFSSWHYFYHV